MKLVIAGSRTVDPSIEDIDAAIGGIHDAVGPIRERITEVICGVAPGGDRAGERWAKHYKIEIHYEPITDEDMNKWGKYLGPKQRNRRMADRGDRAIIFWDGHSGGSADMCTRMVIRGKPVHVLPARKRETKPRTPKQ